MNREEFLRQLENLLSGISKEERSDAMAFYQSYFEDAGEENEDAIIKELGSPKKVAESILKDFGIDGNGSGYNAYAKRDAEYYRNLNTTQQNLARENAQQTTGKNNSGWTTAAIVIAVLTSPIWLSLLLAVACVLFSIVAVLFAIAVSVAAVMVALVITGFALIGTGFGVMIGGNIGVGFGLAGAGLLILALGLLAVVLTVWLFGVFLPWAVKGLWNLCKKPFEKRREEKAL